MLKNDKMNLIIALLIAIGLWVYVMGVDNPEIDLPVRNVPITFANADTLAENSLVHLSSSDSNVTVTVRGHRTEVTDVERTDLRVVADLEGLQAGENTVQLRVTSKPDGVEVKELSKRKITVIIDEIVTKEKPIHAAVSGDAGTDREPYIVQLEHGEVEVTGAKSLVESVKHVSAVLDVKLVKDELRAINVDLLPVDKDGNTVDGVTLKERNVSVTAVMLNKKTVPLQVPVVGVESEIADRTVNVPKTITVKGYASALRSITSVTAERVDVSKIFTDTSLKIQPILPEGIEVASNSRNLRAEVKVTGLETRSFTYGKEAIIVEGITEGWSSSVSDTAIVLQVMGKEYDIEGLQENDFYFVADIEGLEPGVHQVPLVCQHEKNVSEISFTPPEVTVTIAETEDMQPPADENMPAPDEPDDSAAGSSGQ